jgi:hypothetical protein
MLNGATLRQTGGFDVIIFAIQRAMRTIAGAHLGFKAYAVRKKISLS